MLTCGSIDPRTKVITKSNTGTPQGNVASPVLANIVLDKLDRFMANYKSRFDVGKKRKENKQYTSLRNRRRYTKDVDEKRRI